MASYVEYNGVIINKVTLDKYKELKEAGQLVSSEVYVIEDYLGEYTYVCNGSTDNIQIGNIVRAFLNGGTDYRSLKLKVIGTFGMTSAATGAGTSGTPYYWFNLNIQSNRRATIDFTNCTQISPTIADGTSNVIFHSNNGMHIIGANVVANNTSANTTIRITNNGYGAILFEDCRFWVNGYVNCFIGTNGTYINCRGSISNVTSNSYCFYPVTTGLVRIIGGEYYAYTASSSNKSAIIGQSGTDAVSILFGVNAPTAERTGYYQTHSIIQTSGGGMVNCTDLVSALPLSVVSGISNIRGTIAKSKPNLM